MRASSWRRIALVFCMLAVTAMPGASRADDAVPAPTPASAPSP